MHIKDLTSRILELGIVKSNCATSLETLLYRQTSGGSQGKGNSSRGVTGPSKFTRVTGKHGWFGLKPSVLQEESDLNVSLESVDDILMDDKNRYAVLCFTMAVAIVIAAIVGNVYGHFEDSVDGPVKRRNLSLQ